MGKALPPHDLIHLLVQGYNGLPIVGSHIFGDAVYFDTAAYLGVIAVALAVLGVVRGRHRPEVIALTAVAVVTTLIVFAPPVESLFVHVPLLQTIDWHRELMVLGLCVAVLAGVGMDALVRREAKPSIDLILGGVFAGCLVLLAGLWLFGSSGLSAVDASLRRQSLLWPTITAGGGLVVVLLHAFVTGRKKASPSHRIAGNQARRSGGLSVPSIGQVSGALLLVLETAFLVASGAQLWSSSAGGAPPTPAVSTLERSVGGATVGFGTFTCFAGPAVTALGILPEANILYDVHEFDFYDPILPADYFASWAGVSHSQAGVPIFNSFCPAITTAAQARRFGVSYVLEPAGIPGPAGAVFVSKVGRDSPLSDSRVLRCNPGPAIPIGRPAGGRCRRHPRGCDPSVSFVLEYRHH